MERKKGKPTRYAIRFARVRFESVVIEVDGDDDHYSGRDRAVKLAEEQMALLPGNKWRLEPFKPKFYEPFVEAILGEHEIDVAMEPGETLNDLADDVSDDYRYVLVRGDIQTGEGEVVMQPWFLECDKLMQSDIAGDWVGVLEDAEIKREDDG